MADSPVVNTLPPSSRRRWTRHRTSARAGALVAGTLVGLATLAGPLTASAADPTAVPSGGRPVVGGDRLAAPGVLTDLPAGVPAPPPLAAASYVVADLQSGAVIVARAAHSRGLPASTLKALTVLVTLPQVNPDSVVQAVPADLVEGTKVGLVPGSRYTVRQLLQGTMLASGNDTATALARAAGGVPQTVARMQSEALELGALDTTVRNPSGLDEAGQLTSAYDLALIARAALSQPAVRELVATRRVRFPGKEVRGARRASYEIQNHNRLLYNYPGAIGVKNGYTVAARWTVVGAATRGGRSYVVTALRRTDSSWRPEAALLDWAFAYGRQARPVGRLVVRGEVPPPAGALADGQADGQAAAGMAGQGPGARQVAVRAGLGAAGLGAAGLAILVALLLAGLSSRARRQQLHAARAARSARQPRA